ncbi:MAG: hypothetical protein JKY44_04600 [Flavobacteriaceae bacterium]|nr:hypothetical protein [Flavobacteriaceae bacterium]
MTKHYSPMQFFTGSKKGVFLNSKIVSEVISTFKMFNIVHSDEWENVDLSLTDMRELLERLEIAVGASLADDLMKTLESQPDLSDETKATALTIALGKITRQ